MLYRFFGLGHYAIVRSDNQNHDIGDLGTAGASALAAALSRGALPKLKVLFIGGNEMGDEALAALAPALRQRPAFKRLSLGHNRIGDVDRLLLVAVTMTGVFLHVYYGWRTVRKFALHPERAVTGAFWVEAPAGAICPSPCQLRPPRRAAKRHTWP